MSFGVKSLDRSVFVTSQNQIIKRCRIEAEHAHRLLATFHAEEQRASSTNAKNIGGAEFVNLALKIVNDQILYPLYRKGSLFDLLTYEWRCNAVDDFIRIAQQMALGIRFIHYAGLVHCDLKPENILITDDGNIKICDFGHSMVEDRHVDTWRGSLGFMAPEVVDRNFIMYTNDWWSLGVVLFELVTGRGIIPSTESLDVARRETLELNIKKLNIYFLNPENLQQCRCKKSECKIPRIWNLIKTLLNFDYIQRERDALAIFNDINTLAQPHCFTDLLFPLDQIRPAIRIIPLQDTIDYNDEKLLLVEDPTKFKKIIKF